jgi:hypothetical protein
MLDLSQRAALVGATIVAGGVVAATAARAQGIDDYKKTADGLTVYFGVMPAEIVKGRPIMHGGVPPGPHEHHIVVAIFDAAGATRVSVATVIAKVSGLGLSGSEKTLEPMKIADTITYGGFFNLPGADLYTITVSIRRPGSQQPVSLDFKYDHRHR